MPTLLPVKWGAFVYLLQLGNRRDGSCGAASVVRVVWWLLGQGEPWCSLFQRAGRRSLSFVPCLVCTAKLDQRVSALW